MRVSVPLILFAVAAIAAPGDWKEIAGSSDGTVMISFALPQRNMDRLVSMVNGGMTKYLSRAQLKNLIAPGPEHAAAVCRWLNFDADTCSEATTAGGDWVRKEFTIDAASKLFGKRFARFEHERAGVSVVRSAEGTVAVPAEIAEHVTAVFGADSFPVPSIVRDSPSATASEANTPANLRKLYGIGATVFSGTSNSSQGLAEFQEQNYSPKDLAHFQKKYNVPAQTVRKDTGKKPSIIGHTEANLDVQYIMAVSEGTPTDFFLQKGMSFDLIGWVTAVEADAASPLVWSVSYGEYIGTQTTAVAQRLDAEFVKLAALGVSVIFASGDSGVYSRQAGTTTFMPSFPACLPHVTAVGGVQPSKGGESDEAWPDSGGGFSPSKYFTRSADAPWQEAAAGGYLNGSTPLPAASNFDAAGVGFPDVSARSVNYPVVVDFMTMSVAGTSCAAPVFAGIVAMVNDALLNAGKPALGFLNPFIYSNADVFTDITSGSNPGSGKTGFSAAKGWDPATGVGTPNFPQFKDRALQ